MFRTVTSRVVVAVALSVCGTLRAQDSALSNAPPTTLPALSYERLGTGLPPRLPKLEVQRPVYTIQSGGPVAIPKPQFRPTPETSSTTAFSKEAPKAQPVIEQTRTWQNAGLEKPKTGEQSGLPKRPATPNTAARIAVSPFPPAARLPSPPLTDTPLTSGRSPTPQQQRPQSRSAPAQPPTVDQPARVLNFSIN